MEPGRSASVLWLRALFAGTFAFFLGTAGHLMADGLLPGPAFLVMLYVVLVGLSVPVLARPASRLRTLGVLVGGQTVIHLCLTLSAGHVGDPEASAASVPRGTGFAPLPEVDGRRVGSLQDAFVGSDAMPHQTPTLPVHHLVADLSAHAPMMAAHLAAATLVGLWLAYGERCLVRVVQLTARVLLRLARPVLIVTVRPAPRPGWVADAVAAGLRSVLLGPSVSRRGPPLLAG
ncbi:hypothetical protein [Nocardioides halotolerans]|uniref:hypothetical protein n=1 Tax=Nocardioides halotolerans TaxID=433660 RepID=UPI000402E47C|nr:hypothetical protein [Nocardioides halotolerans]